MSAKEFSQFTNDLAQSLYEVTALVNAIETMAESHENGESDQVLTDLSMLTRSARRLLQGVVHELDIAETKYEKIQ